MLGQELRRRQLKDVQAAGDLRSVDVAVVPVGGPVTAEHEHLWINRPPIEIADFNRMIRVGEVHDGDATLVPGLHFDVAARNRNERPVVRHTVLAVGLGRRQLVVTRKAQLIVLQTEDRISAPLVRIVRPASSA